LIRYFLLQIMYSPFVKIILLPLSFLYGIITSLRNFLFDIQLLPSKEFSISVICVGNISVGGTGKTPHIEYILELLKEEYKVAILSRGYKRTTSGFQIATTDSTVFDVGDEPRQLKQKYPSITVAVDGNRKRGILKLLEIEKDLDVILLDDGFQHRWVKPGYSIVLVDYNKMITEDYFLPGGRLREGISGIRRAQMIILSKCPDSLKPIERRIAIKDLSPIAGQNVYFTHLIYGNLQPVFTDSAKEITLEEIKKLQAGLLLVTGIACPQMLKNYLQHIAANIEELKYPDHYAFSQNDINEICRRFNVMDNNIKFIVTTEKDAMRLQYFPQMDQEVKSRLYYVPVQVKFLDDEESQFNKHIQAYVGNNKRNRILSKKHP
jgi:tetraacyldisaccharide 4'-kinase